MTTGLKRIYNTKKDWKTQRLTLQHLHEQLNNTTKNIGQQTWQLVQGEILESCSFTIVPQGVDGLRKSLIARTMKDCLIANGVHVATYDQHHIVITGDITITPKQCHEINKELIAAIKKLKQDPTSRPDFSWSTAPALRLSAAVADKWQPIPRGSTAHTQSSSGVVEREEKSAANLAIRWQSGITFDPNKNDCPVKQLNKPPRNYVVFELKESDCYNNTVLYNQLKTQVENARVSASEGEQGLVPSHVRYAQDTNGDWFEAGPLKAKQLGAGGRGDYRVHARIEQTENGERLHHFCAIKNHRG